MRKPDYNHDAGHNLEGYTISKAGELSCGCIVGEFLCPEAERLWREVNYHYNLLKGQSSTFPGWTDYDNALNTYRNHRKEIK